MDSARAEQIFDQLVAGAEVSPRSPAEVQFLQQARSLLNQLSSLPIVPPVEWIERAKALMPPRPSRRIVAKPVPILGNAFRKGVSDNFQRAFHAEGKTIRVGYSRIPEGWEVLCAFSGDGYCIEAPGGDVQAIDSGRFRFTVESLEDAHFSVFNKDEVIEIPTPED